MLSQAVAESFRRSGKPEVLIAASAIGFYGDRGSERLTEERAPGSGFLSQLCVDWEAASAPAREAGVRVIHLRIGMVLGRGGGALPPLLTPFRLGLGGRIGSGKQYWSWVSLDDLVHMIVFGLPTKTLAGAVNAVGPEPVTNSEFTEALGEVLHRPTLFPLPEWVVRMALGEMGQALLLCSARVEAGKLKEAGYRFRHLHLREALHDAVM
jgi:uncharacterized protein (TIGR01777 family)